MFHTRILISLAETRINFLWKIIRMLLFKIDRAKLLDLILLILDLTKMITLCVISEWKLCLLWRIKSCFYHQTIRPNKESCEIFIPLHSFVLLVVSEIHFTIARINSSIIIRSLLFTKTSPGPNLDSILATEYPHVDVRLAWGISVEKNISVCRVSISLFNGIWTLLLYLILKPSL